MQQTLKSNRSITDENQCGNIEHKKSLTQLVQQIKVDQDPSGVQRIVHQVNSRKNSEPKARAQKQEEPSHKKPAGNIFKRDNTSSAKGKTEQSE